MPSRARRAATDGGVPLGRRRRRVVYMHGHSSGHEGLEDERKTESREENKTPINRVASRCISSSLRSFFSRCFFFFFLPLLLLLLDGALLLSSPPPLSSCSLSPLHIPPLFSFSSLCNRIVIW